MYYYFNFVNLYPKYKFFLIEKFIKKNNCKTVQNINDIFDDNFDDSEDEE